MAGNTRYHRIPEDARPSMDSTGEDERLITPNDDNDTPTSPKKKEFKYSFHPTIFFRFIAGVLFLAAAIQFVVSQRYHSIPIAVFNFIALGREIWVLLHHFLTRYIRVRVRIELRRSGSSISTKPSKKLPSWLLLGFVQVAIDLLLVPVIIGTCLAVRHHSTYYYGATLPAKILTFIALFLHVLSTVDLGQPSKLTWSGKFSFDTGNDDDDNNGNPPQLPIYRDVEATGAGAVGVQSRKTGADSPPGII